MREVLKNLPDDTPIVLFWEEWFSTDAGTWLSSDKEESVNSAHIRENNKTNRKTLMIGTTGYCPFKKLHINTQVY